MTWNNATRYADLSTVATDRQVSFIKSLLEIRIVAPEHVARLTQTIERGGLSKPIASQTIDWLKRQPTKPREAVVEGDTILTADGASQPGVDVPAGRYAVEDLTGLKFYIVDKPTEGRWAGRTFVSVQAGDDSHRIRDAVTRVSILARIAADVQGAMIRYGKELGHCGHCGRTLTNQVSRDAGIGPVCRDKMGW